MVEDKNHMLYKRGKLVNQLLTRLRMKYTCDQPPYQTRKYLVMFYIIAYSINKVVWYTGLYMRSIIPLCLLNLDFHGSYSFIYRSESMQLVTD